MKKIVITTFINANNYGAQYQAYALYKILSEKYEVEFLNYKDFNIEKNYHLTFAKGTKIKDILKFIILSRKNRARNKRFEAFRKKYLKVSDKVKTIQEIEQKIDADVLITGSDQVWNPEITGGISDIYTLNFGNNDVKRISYAASIGLSSLDSENEKKLIQKIKKIDAISLREKTGCDLVANQLPNKEIKQVIDPTLLLDEKVWLELANNTTRKPVKEKYIFVYILENNKQAIEIANELSKKTGFKIVYFDRINKGYKNVLKNEFTAGPEEFLWYLKNAQYVVVSSFHGSVFSILFEKKFWVIPHKTTSSRVENLLGNLNLSNRMVNNVDIFKNYDYNEEIEYEAIKEKINELKKDSLRWLSESIEK